MSVIDTLIFDRTESDLAEWRRIRETAMRYGGISNIPSADRNVWSNGMKCCYNATDINRICEAILYLQALFEAIDITITGTVTTNWTNTQRLTPDDVATILGMIEEIRSGVGMNSEYTPSDLNPLTLDKMNRIERILYKGEGSYQSVLDNTIYSDEMYCGEAFR